MQVLLICRLSERNLAEALLTSIRSPRADSFCGLLGPVGSRGACAS